MQCATVESGPKPSYFIKYFILMGTVMGGKKEITLNWIELSWTQLEA